MDPATQPTSIRRAAMCLWVSVAIVVIVTLLQVIGIVPSVDGTIGMTVTIGLITAALLAFVAVKTSAGRGWVRWLFLIMFVFGTLATALAFVISPQIVRALPGVLQLNMALQTGLQTVALALMFTSEASAWFKTGRNRSGTTSQAA